MSLKEAPHDEIRSAQPTISWNAGARGSLASVASEFAYLRERVNARKVKKK